MVGKNISREQESKLITEIKSSFFQEKLESLYFILILLFFNVVTKEVILKIGQC